MQSPHERGRRTSSQGSIPGDHVARAGPGEHAHPVEQMVESSWMRWQSERRPRTMKRRSDGSTRARSRSGRRSARTSQAGPLRRSHASVKPAERGGEAMVAASVHLRRSVREPTRDADDTAQAARAQETAQRSRRMRVDERMQVEHARMHASATYARSETVESGRRSKDRIMLAEGTCASPEGAHVRRRVAPTRLPMWRWPSCRVPIARIDGRAKPEPEVTCQTRARKGPNARASARRTRTWPCSS